MVILDALGDVVVDAEDATAVDENLGEDVLWSPCYIILTDGEEEQEEFDALQREIDTLTVEIEAEERAAQTATQNQEEAQRAIQAERARIQTIEGIGRDFSMDVTSFVESGATVETVREAALEHVRKHGAPISAHGSVTMVDEQDKFRAAAADALVMRSGMSVERPAEGARELMGMSLRDLAIESLEMEGHSGLHRKSNDEIYQMAVRQFYNPTAAFPAILAFVGFVLGHGHDLVNEGRVKYIGDKSRADALQTVFTRFSARQHC